MSDDGAVEFDDLYRRHHPAVRRYVRRRLLAADADDVVGDIFAIAWRRRHDLPPESGQLPWLYGTARRVLANEHRRVRRLHALTDRLENQDRPASSGVDPSDQAAGLIDVARAFDRLSDDDQELLRLVAWESLDTADVARVLDCSRPAAAMRIARARRRLRKQLDCPEIPSLTPSAIVRRPTRALRPEREVRR